MSENRARRLKYWEDANHIAVIRGFARRGFTLEIIARKMGISRGTLWRWMKESDKIREALKFNASKAALYAVEAVLERKAIDGEAWAVKQYLNAFGGETHNPDRYIGCESESDDISVYNEVIDVLEGEVDIDAEGIRR